MMDLGALAAARLLRSDTTSTRRGDIYMLPLLECANRGRGPESLGVPDSAFYRVNLRNSAAVSVHCETVAA